MILYETIKNFITNAQGLRAELLRGAVGSFGIKALNALLAFGVQVLLARSLSKADGDGYELYTLVFSLMLLLAIPVRMGLPTLAVREVAQYKHAARWGLLRGLLLRSTQTVLLLSVLAAAAVVAFAVIAVALGLFDDGDSAFLTTGAWALVFLPISSLMLLWGSSLRGLRRVVLGQLPELVLRPSFFLIVLGVAMLGPGLLPHQAMALHCAAAGLALVVGALILLRSLPPEVASSKAQYDTPAWLRSAIPLSLLSAIAIGNQQVGILMLRLLAPAGELGQYKVVISVGVLVTFALGATGAVLGPHIARLYSEGDLDRLQRMLTWVVRGNVLLAIPFAAVFIFFGAPLLAVFGESYRDAAPALIIIAIGQLVNATMGPVGLILNMAGHERETLKGLSVGAGINILLAFLLIPSFGAVGAATAFAVSLITWNLILCHAVWRKTGLLSTPFPMPFVRKHQ
jgi:O-antigen/teichoic acid export membrane protein